MKVVLKLSGKVLEQAEHRDSLAEQVRELIEEGYRLALVHGGGKQLTELCQRLGIEVTQVQGRRITDEATRDAARMVFSAINRDLVATLLAHDIRAVGFAAFDGFLTRTHRRPPLAIHHPVKGGSERFETIDFGLVGEIDEVDPMLLELLWSAGITPVVSCLCADRHGTIMNINADTLAAELALAVQASRLVSVSDVEGIYLDVTDPESLIRRLDAAALRQHLRDGTFTEGMVPKVQAALKTLERGLPSFQILNGSRPGALREGIHDRAGTILYR